jgi:hypothetical protein|tara:strand:+ start:2554 stop:3486 length:933 start_codon:yes stop_codon:yes gene_type:complete
MMSELQLMNDMPESYKSLLAQLEPETNLSGGSSGSSSRRLSIRGGVFRNVINGKEVGELDARSLNAVIVKAAPISRMYYEGQYVVGESSAPACWSADINTQRASDDVAAEARQGTTCNECPQNIKGSGMGESKACRFQQRVALLLADQNGKIISRDMYMLSLPATSIFGGSKEKMSMKAYAQHLASFQAPIASLVTEIRFDTDASTPRLCFKPVRALEEDELQLAIEVQKSEEAEKVVALTVGAKNTDAVSKDTVSKPPLFQLPTPPVEAAATEEVEEVEAEPKVKVSKKKADAPKAEADLAGLLDKWDD